MSMTRKTEKAISISPCFLLITVTSYKIYRTSGENYSD